MTPNSTYISRTSHWLDHAGVRNWSPPPADRESGLLAFSPDHVSIARHPDVVARDGIVEALLERHLARFTHFTEALELRLVTPFGLALRLADVPFEVSVTLAADAGRVAIDEIWHADTARELRGFMSDVAVPCLAPFLTLLEAEKRGRSAEHRRLIEALFTGVSETMITGTLNEVPRDPRVRNDVRAALKEHAREEAYHHAIFGQMIGTFWAGISDADRNWLGPLWGPAIRSFVAPDLAGQEADLMAVGFSPVDARGIASEAAEEALTGAQIRKAGAGTLRFLMKHGVLDHGRTRRSLEAVGLLD